MPLRVAFFGTPAFAVPTLARIHESAHVVAGVVTQPDRPRGRGHRVVPSAVKQAATDRNLPVLQPEKLRDPAFLAAFADLGADIGVVAAYGKILAQSLLDTPRLGMVNVHASLLPRWRGAAPIHRAILAGDEQTGVTIMRMVQALDAGPSLARAAVPIGPEDTSADLEARLADLGAPLLVDILDRLALGPVVETPQPEEGATYASRLEREDSQIDWARPAQDIHNQIRGLHPWPLSAGMVHGRRIRLHRSRVIDHESTGGSALPGTIVGVSADGIDVAARPGVVRLLLLQPDGKPPMRARDFLNGHPLQVGDVIGPLPPAL